MSKLVFGVGTLGEGPYKSRDSTGKQDMYYRMWTHMLGRCYSGEHRAYDDCSVCDEWLNFQNFCKWLDNNYYTVGEEMMCLDKDILVKGNRIYSADTCIIVPSTVNKLFIKQKKKSIGLPIGVRETKEGNFQSLIRINGKQKCLGTFNNSNQAFIRYKEAKENVIKEVAWKYRYYIPIKLYDALMAYEVEISD